MVAQPAKNLYDDPAEPKSLENNDQQENIVDFQNYVQQKKEAEIAKQIKIGNEMKRAQQQQRLEKNKTARAQDPNSGEENFLPYGEAGGQQNKKNKKTAKAEDEDEESEEKKGLGEQMKDGAKDKINRLGKTPMSIINRKKIKQIRKKIKEQTTQSDEVQKKIANANKLLRSFKNKRFRALMMEMYRDLGISLAEGVASAVTFIGVVLSIFWYWSLNLLIILFFYVILKKPSPSVLRLIAGDTVNRSQMYQKNIERTEKLIKDYEKRKDKIQKQIRKLKKEQIQLTNILN